ncbi:MAG: glycosyltransferase family 92 protein [Rickettsiales bacterium]|jgi:hypothetical protein|nr:glycosyltransferase family 92 protein [Rickettsiales bacterium]
MLKKYFGLLAPLLVFYHRIRAILKLGILRYLRVRFLGADGIEKFPYFLSVVACAKNEGHDFAEWIEYHRIVGVEKFYIYDNESTDDTRKILEPYIKSGVVEYIYWPGKKQQLPMYRDGLLRAEKTSRWVAVIDLDEFLVPVKDDSVSDFLRKVPRGVNSVYLGWRSFSSNGHITRPVGLVIENYTKFSIGWQAGTGKSIVNPRAVVGVSNPHIFNLGRGRHTNEKFRTIHFWDWNGKISLSNQLKLSADDIRVNHYHTKSREEFLAKGGRGRASVRSGGVKYRFSIDRWNLLEQQPTMPDDSINRFIPAIKKRMQ